MTLLRTTSLTAAALVLAMSACGSATEPEADSPAETLVPRSPLVPDPSATPTTVTDPPAPTTGEPDPALELSSTDSAPSPRTPAQDEAREIVTRKVSTMEQDFMEALMDPSNGPEVMDILDSTTVHWFDVLSGLVQEYEDAGLVARANGDSVRLVINSVEFNDGDVPVEATVIACRADSLAVYQLEADGSSNLVTDGIEVTDVEYQLIRDRRLGWMVDDASATRIIDGATSC